MASALLPESVRDHPDAWGSVACHVLLLGCLLAADRLRADDAAPQVRVPPSPALSYAREERLARQIQRMERIKRMLEDTRTAGRGATPGGKPAAAGGEHETAATPEQQARRLAADIERILHEDQAAELARVLGIAEQDALARVRPQGQPGKPLSIEQLVLRADQALLFRQRKLEHQRNGVKLGERGGAELRQPGPRSERGSGGHTVGGVIGTGYDPDSAHTVIEHRDYGREIATPMVDAGRMRADTGRMFGAGGTYANRVYLNSWYMIGPFAGVGPESIDTPFAPERTIDLDAVYAGKGGKPLRWHYEQFGQYPLVPDAYRESAVYYGYTELDMDRERDVLVSMGADDDAKLWVNGQLVWRSGNHVKPWYRLHFRYLKGRLDTRNLNEVTLPVRLAKGRNHLLFKLYNGSGATFVSIVVSPAGARSGPAKPRP